MKAIHCIAGVPRSGSTLFCNILNQNPAFHATDTSPIPEILGTLTQRVSGSPEIQGLLNLDTEGAQERVRSMFRSMVKAWYSDTDKIVFDKSRGWSFFALLMADLFPEARFIVTVRDLRDVFASIEKQHRKNPFFDQAGDVTQKTILNRADMMLAPDGMIGGSATGLVDLMARLPDRVFPVSYEALTRDPGTKMSELYDFLELPAFEHQFEDVKNVSHEPDHIHMNKFPHVGAGKVKPATRGAWKDYLDPELGGLIFGRYPQYNQAFGYQ
jgi:sulfotransferase